MIYLIKCTLCNKQHVEKAETVFNIRLDNYQKDAKNPNAILACKHFQNQGLNFNKHTEFVIIDELTNTKKLW